MLPRRLLSTKALRPLKQATRVESGAKTTASQLDAAAKAATDTDTNPWSHFAAFSSMDDYVDVTLIQYSNTNEDDKDNYNKA